MRKALAALAAGSLAVAALTAGVLTLAPSAASAQDVVAEDGASTADEHATLEDVLGELVDEGVITQAQADVVAERLREHAHHRGFGHQRGERLQVVADVLGMDLTELAGALRDGQTIAEVAGDQTQDVIDALVTEAQERLAAAVDAERLTQEEADEKLAELTDRITAMVNGEFDGRRGHHGPRHVLEDAASTSDA